MYKRPSYDIKTTGIFTFKTKDKEYLLKSYSFERENDTEDSLEIQDELRGEIGSIRIKNSAWNKLAKGQTILAKTSKSKGDIVGKLTRIDDINNSEKYAKGGISGDIFSVKDPKLFKQILTIYNEFSEKFGVDNYFLDHNDNSVIFLRKKPFTPTEIDNMSKRIFSLKEKQDFDVLNKYKNTESSGGTFKFFLKNSIKYADGGMSIADANPYIAGAKAVQGIAPESVSALDKRVSSRINPDPNRPVFFNLGGRLDLFEDYENIPAKVQAVLDKYADKFGDDFSEMDYSDTAEMQKDIEKLGYTFDSGLDNMPYGLRPIGVKLSELQGFEDDSEYKTGGSVKVNSGDGDDEILFRDFTKGDLKFVNYQEKKLSNNKVTYLYLHTYNSMKDAKADGGKDYVYLERNGKIFSFFPSIETYEQNLSSKYAKGGWILYDADTDSKIGEFETETKARKMMYEYEGNSNIVASSVWDKSSEKDKIYKNNTMEKKTSRFAKGGATYIPNADIESIKLRYGKTIKGSRLLDGAYAKGNLKTPTMSRTQFEDETFEYAKGGGIKSEYHIFEGMNHRNGNPIYRVESNSDSKNEYVGEWHTSKSEAEEELADCSSKYAKGGGVSYHNGREYATGRNWTNDYQHENRSEDWEVAQADRKRLAKGGGVGKNIYNVAFSTKNGSSYVANNIEASSEAEAISKLEKQMRASKTYDKVISVSKKYSLGGEIETKIAKLQVVIDSKLLPDSVKESAKTKQDALIKELHESKETKAEEKAEHKVGGEEARKTVPTQKAKPTAKPKAVVEPKIQIKAIKLQPKATAQEKPKVVVAEKPIATVITKTPAKTTSTKKYDNRGSKKPDSDGRFKRSITSDKKRTALPLGKRMSADGNVYYENRLNRADRNPSKKYETGGGVSNLPYSFRKRLENVKNRYGIEISKKDAIDSFQSGEGASSVGYMFFNADNKKSSTTIGDIAIDYGRWLVENEMLFKNGGSLPKGRFTKK
jgi:hypothetical protein